MCGICGRFRRPVGMDEVRDATDLLYHRGPDESGYFVDHDVSMGMRRLSIIDLAGGQQPKTNENGTLQVIFNGEIYNYRELQRELTSLGHTFSSRSDTEVIVHAFEEWGAGSFRRLNGIFALALYDLSNHRLVLARDHLGVKPLYYSTIDGSITFGSELKPVVSLLGHRPDIDPLSATLYFRYGYVPAPRSIFRGIFKLPPGHYLEARADRGPHTVYPFWNPLEHADSNRCHLDPREAEDRVDLGLRAAVHRQMISDVPLGAFLSGGTDSSSVVAMMQQVSNAQARTFAIGFEEKKEDESRFAAAVARHLGTDHHSLIVTQSDAQAVIPLLPQFFDEPFADASAIPTFLVSQLARRHVTVSLSGDGGDELFGGYTRYRVLRRVKPWWAAPPWLRRSLLPALSRAPGKVGQLARHGSNVLSQDSLGEAYRNLMASLGDSLLQTVVSDRTVAMSANDEWPGHLFGTHGLKEAMMLTDLSTYLPDDILTKVDRASMAHSLEARVPLLDVPLVEMLLGMPTSVRLGSGPKSLLKRVLRRYVPAELVDRPKQGFGIPIHSWLRGGLREALEDCTSTASLQQYDLLQADGVQRLVQDHLSGTRDRGYQLWPILMFQLWEEHSRK